MTTVLNFFSWNKAYSLFPLSTFVYHKGYMLVDVERSLPAKYASRGWTTKDILSPGEGGKNNPLKKRRRVGDRFTWMIPFDTTNVTTPNKPTYVLENSWFELRLFQSPPEQSEHSLCRVVVIKSAVLKWEYTAGEGKDFWNSYVRRRVDKLVAKELQKDQNLVNSNGVVRYPRLGFSSTWMRGEGWPYYDDMIPLWAKKWEEAHPTMEKLYG
jgi:hypothetical protein